MTKKSAGILLYRFRENRLEVFLVHPGGPFWAKKDRAAWSIPKGEFDDSEDPLQAARREFREETGFCPEGDCLELGSLKQSGGKLVYAWALEGDCNADAISSNMFEMAWPPKSGRKQRFPEVDRAAWFAVDQARDKLHKGQVAFLDRLTARLDLSFH